MECVKNAHRWAVTSERAKPKEEKKSTMPVLFPLNIYTLDSKPCSHRVENGYDKTWLENDQSVHLEYCTLNEIHKAAILRGRNTAYYRSVMES